MRNIWKVSAGFCEDLEGLQGGGSNTWVVVSAMDEANLQGMIYYIKHFKRIGHTFKHANVELAKVPQFITNGTRKKHTMTQKLYPPPIQRIGPIRWKRWKSKSENFEVDEQPISYGLRNNLEPPAATSDPKYRANGSEYFTDDE